MIPFWRKIVHQDIQEVSLQIFILYITICRRFDYLSTYKILFSQVGGTMDVEP